MKKYTYEITDKNGFSGEMSVTCERKKEAEEKVKLYIYLWDLYPASYTLLKVEELDQEEGENR